jgi:polyvinyl alcohol dehydrogenase (cytochrome)
VSADDVFTLRSPRSEDSDFGTNPILFEAEVDGVERKLLGAGQKSGMFWVLDRETGDVVWQRQVSDGSALIGGVFNNGAYDGRSIVVAGNDGTSSGPGSEPANGNSKPLGGAEEATSVLMALDPATGRIRWERQLPAWVWAPITLADGVGFVAVDRDLQAFDTKTGKKLLEVETDGTISSAPATAGDRVYFGSGLSYFTTKSGRTVYALEG